MLTARIEKLKDFFFNKGHQGVRRTPESLGLDKLCEKYGVAMITIHGRTREQYYSGVAACYMTVNKQAKRGYKSMPEHVNHMDKSLKGKLVVSQMDDSSRQVLKAFLKNHNEEMWNHSSQELHEALESSENVNN